MTAERPDYRGFATCESEIHSLPCTPPNGSADESERRIWLLLRQARNGPTAFHRLINSAHPPRRITIIPK